MKLNTLLVLPRKVNNFLIICKYSSSQLGRILFAEKSILLIWLIMCFNTFIFNKNIICIFESPDKSSLTKFQLTNSIILLKINVLKQIITTSIKLSSNSIIPNLELESSLTKFCVSCDYLVAKKNYCLVRTMSSTDACLVTHYSTSIIIATINGF